MPITSSSTGDAAYFFHEQGHHYVYSDATGALVQLSPAVAERVLADRERPYDELLPPSLTSILLGAPRPRSEAPVDAPSTTDPSLSEAYVSLTNTCNLACRYCFAASACGDARAPDFMSTAVIDSTVTFLAEHANARTGLSLVLWGGEPLLRVEQTEYMLRRARAAFAGAGIPLRIATTTNGTRLTESLADLLARYRVVVNLSIDGTSAAHDRNRVFRDGSGSYSALMRNLPAFLAAYRRHYPEFVPRARVTVDHHAVNALAESYQAIWDAGVPIVWAKDVDWVPEDADFLLSAEDYDVLRAQYERLRRRLIERVLDQDVTVLPQLWWDLHEVHQRTTRQRMCGVGRTSVSVATDGAFTACYHLDALGQEFRVGNVADGLEHTALARVHAQHLKAIESCRGCIFRSRCGGGCLAKELSAASEGRPPHRQCGFIREYLRHCLHLYAQVTSTAESGRIAKVLEQSGS